MVICSRLMGIITPVIVIDSFDFFWGIWEGFVCHYDLDLFVLCLCIDYCSHYPNKLGQLPGQLLVLFTSIVCLINLYILKLQNRPSYRAFL